MAIMKPEEARIGMWVTVQFTGQIVGIDPTRISVRQTGLSHSEVPVECVEELSPTETMGTTD